MLENSWHKKEKPLFGLIGLGGGVGSNLLSGGVVPYAGDLAVTHSGSPYISVYPWDSGFGSKYANPSSSTKPTDTQYGVAFSPDGADIAMVGKTGIYMRVFPWSSSGFGTKYSDPSDGSYPAGTGNSVAFSPDGAAIAIAHNTSPYISAWAWSSGFGTRYSNPSTLPGGHGYGIAFSPDGSSVALVKAYNYSPCCIEAYAWSSSTGFGTKYSDPSSYGLTDIGYGVTFSPDGADIAIAHSGSPYISVYPWSSGFGTKYSDPAGGTQPNGIGRAVAFSPDGSALAVAFEPTPRIHVYPWSSSGFGTKYSDPSNYPSGPSDDGQGVAFSPNGADIALGHRGSPYITVWPWSSSGFGTKYSNPPTLPAYGAISVAFSPA